jgi:3-oxoacyl-[acyl-carrier protein] reductase
MTARRVLVTGASRGIGAALVERFLAAGDQVFGCGRSPGGGGRIAHPSYTYLTADVADEGSVRQLFREIRTRAGGLDVLVNNAGLARMNLLALTPPADARRIVDTNLLGVFHCTQQAVRVMRQSPAGRIVNVTTVAVPLRLEGEALYAASKAAVETLTRIAARELGPLGITCNAVGPTPVRTDLVANVPQEKLDALVARQAIREWATFDDVYNVVDFFLRPESRQVTGQVVYLGGIG